MLVGPSGPVSQSDRQAGRWQASKGQAREAAHRGNGKGRGKKGGPHLDPCDLHLLAHMQLHHGHGCGPGARPCSCWPSQLIHWLLPLLLLLLLVVLKGASLLCLHTHRTSATLCIRAAPLPILLLALFLAIIIVIIVIATWPPGPSSLAAPPPGPAAHSCVALLRVPGALQVGREQADQGPS